MRTILDKVCLRLRLIWNHVVFWGFPTPQENYYSTIGKIWFDHLDYEKAISYFFKSEQSHGSRDLTLRRYNYYYLGYSYLNVGDLRHSVEYLEKYFQLNRSDYETASTIGWYYELISDHQTALQWYQCALALETNLWRCRIESSRLLAELGRREEALKQLENSKAVAHSLLEGQITDSLKQKVCGDLEGAIGTLQRAVRSAEPFDDSSDLAQKEVAYILLARLQREIGDFNGALGSLEAALERNSSDPWIINELAMEYADQNIRLDEALDLIDRALGHERDNPVFHDTKGLVLFKLGKQGEAKAVLERCLGLLPDYQVAKEHYQLVTGQ